MYYALGIKEMARVVTKQTCGALFGDKNKRKPGGLEYRIGKREIDV
jgi:hypothetical protein